MYEKGEENVGMTRKEAFLREQTLVLNNVFNCQSSSYNISFLSIFAKL